MYFFSLKNFCYSSQLVNEIDQDGSGEIDKEEFGEAVSALHADLTEAAGRGSRLKIIIFVISLWMLLGMVLFSFAEDWTLQTSFYFSFVTLATIGLGDFFPTTPFGQIYLVVFIAVGLGMLSVLLTLIEGLLKDAENKRSTENEKVRQEAIEAKRLKEEAAAKEVAGTKESPEKEVAKKSKSSKWGVLKASMKFKRAATKSKESDGSGGSGSGSSSSSSSKESKGKNEDEVERKGSEVGGGRGGGGAKGVEKGARGATTTTTTESKKESVREGGKKQKQSSMVSVVVVDEETGRRAKEVVAEGGEKKSTTPKRRLSPKTSLKTWGTGN